MKLKPMMTRGICVQAGIAMTLVITVWLSASPDSGQSRLTDISMLTRDRVEQLTFKFDRATVIRLKREPDRIIAVFINAANALPGIHFVPPSEMISSIQIKQAAHGGALLLGVSLFLKKTASAAVLLQEFPDRLVVYGGIDSLQRMSTWSARTGPDISYRFITIPHFNVDYRGMEKKALSDLQRPENAAATFTIHEKPAEQGSAVPVKRKAADAAEPENAQSPPHAETDAGQRKKNRGHEAQKKTGIIHDLSMANGPAVQESIKNEGQPRRPDPVEYHIYGRDPFLPLSHDADGRTPNVEGLNLVGILYDDSDRIGLFEDRQNKAQAFALRENDPVQNGYVLQVLPDKVLFLINELGVSRTYALKLSKEKQ